MSKFNTKIPIISHIIAGKIMGSTKEQTILKQDNLWVALMPRGENAPGGSTTQLGSLSSVWGLAVAERSGSCFDRPTFLEAESK